MEKTINKNKVLLHVKNIGKSFASNIVLKGINLNVDKGDVLALIGGNGAGKSTLMKIIMGIYKPDYGEIFINGSKINDFRPAFALSHGIYMVPQEPLLFPNMTVEENILIGFKENQSLLKERLQNIIKELSWELDLDAKALGLSIAQQQIVELLRGMMRNAKLLILDEPTSALTFDEVESLFKIVNELKSKGIGIIYITHRLAEVFEIATHVAIMRDGIITMEGEINQFNKEMLIKGLLPPNIEELSKKNRSKSIIHYDNSKPVFRLEHFSGYGFKDINLVVHPGEILGISGLVGAGRTEFATTVFGMDEVLSGRMFLEDKDITGFSTNQIIQAGINYVPEDRRLNGLFGISSVAANMSSALLRGKQLGKFFLDKKKERSITQKYVDEFRTKVTGQEQLAGSLSGGNQQKVVIGRCLSTLPKLLILDEPTRGIDAAARGDVYSIILDLKKQEVGIILISSDMEEIIELSDRALVMFQGYITGELKKEEISQGSLVNACFNIKSSVH